MMKLEVLSPTATLYQGEVESVTFSGMKGAFTILSRHTPIVSLLTKGNLICKKNGKNMTFLIESGVMEQRNNVIAVCVE